MISMQALLRRWLVGAVLAATSFFLPVAPAQAQTLQSGVDFDGSQATLWLRSSTSLAWVDAHYAVNNGAQQNLRMGFNAGANRFELRFAASSGQTVNYWFTTNNGSTSTDTSPLSAPIGGTGPQPPSFSPPAGSYASAQSVSLVATTPGTTLRYTLDGSTPGAGSALYQTPLPVSSSTTLKAVALASDGTASAVVSAAFVIGGTGGYSQGAVSASGGELIWFSGAGVQWVDLHYSVDNGAQQNVRMSNNAATGRQEWVVTAPAGATLRYSFTYYTGAAADTPSYTVTVGPGGNQAAAPQFSPAGGSYAGAQQVQLSSSTPGAQIRYTLDGSTPSASSALYSTAITVASNLTIKALAQASGYTDSPVAQASYTIGGSNGGVQQGAQDAAGGALIWFSGPSDIAWVDLHANPGTGLQNLRMTYNAASARYETTLAAAAGAIISYGFTYYRPSSGATDLNGLSYTVGGGGGNCGTTVATPSFSPAPGSYASAQTVQIASATAGAEIRYTLDGSTPGAGSTLYSGSVNVASSATLKAIALKACMTNSAVASGSYTITGGGSFTAGVSELGASATIWFQPSAAQQFVILHYSLAGAPEINPQMTYNSAVGRYEFVVSPVAAGQTLNYWFTYQPLGGAQTDSPRYSLVLGGGVAGPVFSPPGGSYATAQTVSLANAAGVSGVIRYTLDGTAPTQQSPIYSAPLSIGRATTVYAVTFTATGQSKISMGNYVIGGSGGQVATPVFSHASGSYATRLRVNLLSDTPGATLRYTTDGSTPTLDSLPYGGPIEVTASQTLKAAAFKAGMTASAVASASYTLSGTGNSDGQWTGQTTFNIVNATRGRWPDSQVYWAIIGKDWNTGQFVHVGAQGQLIPMSLGDNGALMKNGLPYSNYFFTLDQLRTVTIPPINSARILFSVGSPMYIWVNSDANGKIAYAGANIENPSDPNIDVTFDFGEFAILPPGANPQGLFVNTTRVDQFGFPVKLEVTGLDGFRQTVGESLAETRDELFAKFFAEAPAEFQSLGQPPYGPYRIMAPAHATFQGTGANTHYLDSYIDAVWQQYSSQDLVLDLHNGWLPFTGRVVGGKLRFTDSAGGQYFVNGKPSTSMVLLGNGLLDDTSGGPTDAGKQLQLQAQVCAALNRQVAQLPGSQWWNGNRFYPAGQPANAFAKFWHDHSLNALAYGFAYDDVGSFSPSIHTAAPRTVTFSIGW